MLAAPRNAWTLSGIGPVPQPVLQKTAGGAASEGQTNASEAKAIRAGKKQRGLLNGSLANITASLSRPRHFAIRCIGIVPIEPADAPFDAETEAYNAKILVDRIGNLMRSFIV